MRGTLRLMGPPRTRWNHCLGSSVLERCADASVLVAQGVRVELELGGSTGWIESEEVDALVAPLATAAQRKLPTDLLCSDEAACAQRCAKAFLAVKVGGLSVRKLAGRDAEISLERESTPFCMHFTHGASRFLLSARSALTRRADTRAVLGSQDNLSSQKPPGFSWTCLLLWVQTAPRN